MTGTNELPEPWKEREGRLKATYEFKDFAQAMGFLAEVGLRAQSADHHPDFHVSWNKVAFELWSHDKKEITDRDHLLAKTIHDVAQRLDPKLVAPA